MNKHPSLEPNIQDDIKKVLKELDLSVFHGKSILVTGASGLIGIYFLLIFREINKLGIAPKSVTAIYHSSFMKNMKDLLELEKFKLIQGDLTDLNFYNQLETYDYIIPAAGYGQPGKFMENPVKTIELNTSATLILFKHLSKDGRFLFLSSSEVYSGLPAPPFKESQIGLTNTTHSRSCYIEAKRCGEAICNAHRSIGINAYSARLALAYGPGTKPHDQRVLNSFIEKGLTQKNISLQDMGLAKRTYCYISDAIEILLHILLKGTQPIYNVGGFSKLTIAELALKIGKYLDVSVNFPNADNKISGAPDDVYLDMTLVKEEFGKDTYVDFDIGLNKTIKWQKILYS